MPPEPPSVPLLADVPYDSLVVGRRLGPFVERVEADVADELRGEIGVPIAGTLASPAVYPVLFLRALRRGMGGIPAGSVLARQEFEFESDLPVGATIRIDTWVGQKEERRGRRWVTLEFDIRTADGAPVATGRKVIIWPEEADQDA